MKKAGTGKVRGIKEDTLIVTIDIGLEGRDEIKDLDYTYKQ